MEKLSKNPKIDERETDLSFALLRVVNNLLLEKRVQNVPLQLDMLSSTIYSCLTIHLNNDLLKQLRTLTTSIETIKIQPLMEKIMPPHYFFLVSKDSAKLAMSNVFHREKFS